MNSVNLRAIATLVICARTGDVWVTFDLGWLILVMVVPAPKLLESRVDDWESAKERDFSLLVTQFRVLLGMHEVILLHRENITYLKVDPERFHNESLNNIAGLKVW